ncbi:CreA protein [Roseibium album]|nr:CreA protein [Roseibium album]
MRFLTVAALALSMCVQGAGLASAADEPDLIFKKSTVWNLLTPDHKLATYAIDDPIVDGVACHFTVPEKGGVSGWLGVAEEVSDVSLACRQVGPVSIKENFEQGEEMFRQRRSLVFKKMQIVRGCDTKRNVLVYLVYSDKLIEGSPKNSTSTVPLMPWGDQEPPKCGDYLEN